MKSTGARLFPFFRFLLALSTPLACHAQPPTGLPGVIFECDHVPAIICGTWTWDNGHYSGYWSDQAISILTVQSFSAGSVIINRADTAQSAASDLTAVYTGQITSQGNAIVNGDISNIQWPGHSQFPPTATWTGMWGAPTQFTISTVAGNGAVGHSGDGGPATNATFASPLAIALDSKGNLFIADQANNRIREVTPDGTITTIAGTGAPGFAGDNGPATSALLNQPTNVKAK
jgi:hypothetical protein